MLSKVDKMLGKKPSPEKPAEATQTDDQTLRPHPDPKASAEFSTSSSNPFSEDAARAAFAGSLNEAGPEGPHIGPGAGDAAGGLVAEGVFTEALCAGFDVTAQLSGLQSLAIAENEREAAQAAAGGLYAVARKHPSLHWLLRTDGAYVKLAVATLPFCLGKARMAAVELKMRRDGPPSPADEGENPSETA